jgi:SAM-dependent methyltransferase
MASNSLSHALRTWWSDGKQANAVTLETQVQQLATSVEEIAAKIIATADQQRIIAQEVHAFATLALSKSHGELEDIGFKIDTLVGPELRKNMLQAQTPTNELLNTVATKIDALALSSQAQAVAQSDPLAPSKLIEISKRLGSMANEINAIHNAVLLQKQDVAALATTVQVPIEKFSASMANEINAIHNAVLLQKQDVAALATTVQAPIDKFGAVRSAAKHLATSLPAALTSQSGQLVKHLSEIEARSAAHTGNIANEVNAVLNTVRPIFDQVNRLDARLTQLSRETADARTFDAHHTMLLTRGIAALLQRRPQLTTMTNPVTAALPVQSLEAQMAEFKAKAPANFAAWHKAYLAGVEEGERTSEGNLSHKGHLGAEYFRMFINIHASGRLLDVGCGPLSVPSYLADWPTTHLAGIDPQLPFTAHPFAFAQTFAENMPWPDASFETVVVGTSLDHVYLLDQSLAEFTRLLTPNGRLLIWTGMFENTQPYDPYSAAYQPPDAYHLFHPGKNWFYDLFARDYRLIERIETLATAEFLAFERVTKS